MTKPVQPTISKHAPSHGSVASYTVGFILSIVLTIIPFLIVIKTDMEGWLLLGTLTGFAIAQLLVQLVFFLHLGKESGTRWNLIAFLFMMLFLLIVVIGSLWIMDNLNYNMMPENMKEYMMHEEGVHL